MGAILVGVALFMIAAISSSTHGGQLAKAVRSKDPATKQKAEGIITSMLVIGALCLLIAAWPLVLALFVLAIIAKLIK